MMWQEDFSNCFLLIVCTDFELFSAVLEIMTRNGTEIETKTLTRNRKSIGTRTECFRTHFLRCS